MRGLRFVAQLDLDPDDETLAQMREWAPQVRLVSGERIGGGLATDGLGELSKLLLGTQPAKALRLARGTGVLTVVIPEYEAAIGHETGSARQAVPLDEHLFRVVQNAADANAPLGVRLGALLHDLGKPGLEPGADHAARGAEIAGRVLGRLRYPVRLHARVVRIVRHHAFHLDGKIDGARARRFLREHGVDLAADLLALKRADLDAKRTEPWELPALDRLTAAVDAERESPHRLRDLALDGEDLLALGFTPGPALGRALRTLLDEVVEDPSRNEPDVLRERAKALLP